MTAVIAKIISMQPSLAEYAAESEHRARGTGAVEEAQRATKMLYNEQGKTSLIYT